MKFILTLLPAVALMSSEVASTPPQEVLGVQVANISHPYEADLSATRENLEKIYHKHPFVMKQFDALAHTLKYVHHSKGGLTVEEVSRVAKAVDFAANKHQVDMRDADNTPYITHLLGSANVLMTMGKVYDPDVIIGAILQGIIEKSESNFRELEKTFGTRITLFVRELTENRALPKKVKEQVEIAHAPKLSKGATEIKIASKIDDLSYFCKTLPAGWSRENLDEYIDDAQVLLDHLPLVNIKLKEVVDTLIRDQKKRK